MAKVERWEKGAGQPHRRKLMELASSNFSFRSSAPAVPSPSSAPPNQPTPVKGSDAPHLIDTHSSWP